MLNCGPLVLVLLFPFPSRNALSPRWNPVNCPC